MQIFSNVISALNIRESPKYFILQEIGVEEHDGDGGFQTGCGNTAVSRMHNEKYAI